MLINNPKLYTANPSDYKRGAEESHDLADNEWIEDLKEVLLTNSKAEEILLDIRRALNIDGDGIYEQIDKYQLGYITLRNLQNWLTETVHFKLNETESRLVLARYDRDGDYKISKFEFVNEINAPPAEDDGDQVPDDNENNFDYQRNPTHNEQVRDNQPNSNA